MHTLTLTLSSDGDAFTLCPEFEGAHILRTIASAIERGDRQGICRDSDGNRVGSWVACWPAAVELA
jgi:hypothetical protein